MRSWQDTLLSMAALLCLSVSLGLFSRIFLPEAPALFAPYYGVVPEEVQLVSLRITLEKPMVIPLRNKSNAKHGF